MRRRYPEFRIYLFMAAVLAIWACQPSSRTTATNETSAARTDYGSVNLATVAANDIETIPETESAIPEAQPTDGDATPRFVGRWAAAETACGHEAWQFTPTGLQTPGEVSCSFSKIKAVPGGYDIAARCAAEGSAAPDVIRLRFAKSARAMLVEAKKLASVGLIRCGTP